jgi:glycosyltransferase involved in cell wall biosynthesis
LKIAFATVFDPKDVNRGSGTFFHLSREIERQGYIVQYVGPLNEGHLPVPTRFLRAIENRWGKRYKTYLDPFYCRARAAEASQKVAALDYDVLLTNDFGLAAFITTDKPIVLYTDAMIPLDYQNAPIPEHSRIANLGRLGTSLFQRTISEGLKRSTLCVFPTQWIADEALNYGVDPAKVRIVPFGANMEDPGPEVAAGRGFAKILEKGRIDLLFVGKDWERKGGDTAIRTVHKLQERGINAVLHAVGVNSPEPIDNTFIKFYGFLAKSIPQEHQQLMGLYQSCDAFILPSKAEGFVIVVLEASAYGLPVLAYDIDGLQSGVKDHISGYLISPEESEQAFADAINAWFTTPSLYDDLVAGARSHFVSEVNWNASVKKLLASIAEIAPFRP